ncbi:MAG: hypothetical protein IPH03_16575 [Tetrasphaera sp.]|nr:hypothetical protein [Tetrasphaera sp.]
MTAAPTEERGDAVALGRRGIRSLCMRRAIRRNRPLAMLVASIFTYRLAGAMLVVALPFFAVHRFGFGVGAGLVLGARLLPNILFGLVVGHLVDRWEPRRTAWVTAVLNGALVALVPLAGSRGGGPGSALCFRADLSVRVPGSDGVASVGDRSGGGGRRQCLHRHRRAACLLIGLPVLAFTIPLLAAGPDRLPADPLSAD